MYSLDHTETIVKDCLFKKYFFPHTKKLKAIFDTCSCIVIFILDMLKAFDIPICIYGKVKGMVS